MDYAFLPEWPPALGPLSWFAVLLVAATAGGELAWRMLRLPRIVGYVIAGMLLGPYGIGIIDHAMHGELRVLVVVALGLLLFELGHRLSVSWLRSNPWLFAASVVEAALTYVASYSVLRACDVDSQVASGAAAIAVSTSPAVVVRLTAELRSQGQVTERLLMLAALNSVYAVLAVTLWLAWQHTGSMGGPIGLALQPVYAVCGSVLLAAAGATVLAWLHDALGPAEETDFLVLTGVIVAAIALALALKLSVPLSLLCLGALVKNRDVRLRVLPRYFAATGAIFVVMLFALTGAAIDPALLPAGGLVALAFVGARLAAKVCGVLATAGLADMTRRKGLALGIALAPMSSLAVALAQGSAAVLPGLGSRFLEIVLAAVLLMQVLGPIVAAAALTRAGEVKAG